MAEVKWIKIVTDIFDDEKMLLIDSLPDRDGIIVIWFKLLCMAGKQNNGGVFMFNDRLAYTDEMLSTIFRRPLNTVRLALKTFEEYGMIEIVNNAITIPNWDKRQNLDKIEQAKEKNRKKVAAFRERQKRIASNGNVTGNVTVTVTESNQTDKDIDREEDIDIDKDIDTLPADKSANRVGVLPIGQTCNDVIVLYHTICKSYPTLRAKSAARMKTIGARLRTSGIDAIKEVFTKAEASDFLKGNNKNGWKASFDWIIKESNFNKILEGNYDNRNGSATTYQQPKTAVDEELDMILPD